MDIFSIIKGKAHTLNIDNYEELTKKRYPYYQYGKEQKLLCYAVCPECGNPVQIVNLYGAEMMQNQTRVVKTYAKHTRGKVDGFVFWNQKCKEECSLYSPTPLGNSVIKHNDDYSQELKALIEANRKNIFKDIRKIVSINLSTQILNHLFDSFMNSESYGYKAVTKYNIPYAILYYQQSISLYGQYIIDGSLGKIIRNKINCNSKFFEVSDTGEIIKKVKGYRTINLIFTHFKHNGIGDTILLEIYETLDDDNVYSILKERIEMKTYIYY